MAIFQVVFVCISMFVISNAFWVPPYNAGFGEHFLNKKFDFLENKYKDTPVNLDLIRQKIEAKKQAENDESDSEWREYWFLENKFIKGPPFDFIQQKIKDKLQAKISEEKAEPNSNERFEENSREVLDQDSHEVSNEDSDEMLNHNHPISKKPTKNNEEETNVKDPAIDQYFLNQKLAFLQNKFKGSLVDFDAIKEKIEAKKREEAAAQEDKAKEKLAYLLNYLKQLHAEKLNANHQVAKRSTKDMEEGSAPDPAFGAALGNHFLNQKLTFLENKLKGTLVDFDAIKQKIEAKKEAKLLEEAENATNEKEDKLGKKLVAMQNFLKGLSAEQLAAIIEKIEGKHNVAKRSISAGPQYGAGVKDYFLQQKLSFLDSKLKQKNVNSEIIKQKINSKQKKSG